MSDLLQTGGVHNIKKTGSDEYLMNISIPTDKYGMIARECPSQICSPAYFKVKPGTGIIKGQTEVYCPYCCRKDKPSNFTTKAQVKYAEHIASKEVLEGVDRIVRNTFDLDSSGKKKIDAGLFSMEISYKPGINPTVWRPFEEVLQRDLICPKCTLAHSVFGIATWCPDCGSDIFLTHVSKEYQVVKLILSDVDNRRERLGARVAARDIENALEDTVSIFEAVLRSTTRRYLKTKHSSEEVEEIIKRRIGNKYQSISLAREVAQQEFNIPLFGTLSSDEYEELKLIFEKRHPITHNLGIVDRKYLEKVSSGELEGRDIRVTIDDVARAADLSLKVLTDFYPRVFSSAMLL